jgi:hypothetical protein
MFEESTLQQQNKLETLLERLTTNDFDPLKDVEPDMREQFAREMAGMKTNRFVF